ncbi:hypothetical protein TgHK011_009618 [Trichoderma gracile]|nr:hypothetical protein TgHK011_009618 [Trichoderma gracile]
MSSQPQVSVTASHSASRVTAGAPAKACWRPARLVTCHSNSANLYRSGVEVLATDGKRHTPATAVREQWAGHRYERHARGRDFFSRPGSASVSPPLTAAPAEQCGVSEGHCS